MAHTPGEPRVVGFQVGQVRTPDEGEGGWSPAGGAQRRGPLAPTRSGGEEHHAAAWAAVVQQRRRYNALRGPVADSHGKPPDGARWILGNGLARSSRGSLGRLAVFGLLHERP